MVVKGGQNNIKSSSAEKIVSNMSSGLKEKNSANFSHVFFSLYESHAQIGIIW